MADVVLRPARGDASITFGPAFVAATDGATVSRSFPRDGGQGARGAVARIRAYVTAGDPTDRLPDIRQVSLVDGSGGPLVTLPWNGADHDALEAACADAGIPLDRVPNNADGDLGRRASEPLTLSMPPGIGASRPHISLALGTRAIAVTDADGLRIAWPRLGCAPPHIATVARVRVLLAPDGPVRRPPGPYPEDEPPVGMVDWAEPESDGRPRTVTVERARIEVLALCGPEGQPLAYVQWNTPDLDGLRRACARTGVLLEYQFPGITGALVPRAGGVPVVLAAPAGEPVPERRDWKLPPASVPYVVVACVLVALAVIVGVLSAR